MVQLAHGKGHGVSSEWGALPSRTNASARFKITGIDTGTSNCLQFDFLGGLQHSLKHLDQRRMRSRVSLDFFERNRLWH